MGTIGKIGTVLIVTGIITIVYALIVRGRKNG